MSSLRLSAHRHVLLLCEDGIVRVETVLLEVLLAVLGVDLDVELKRERFVQKIETPTLTKGLPRETTMGDEEAILIECCGWCR